MLAWNNQRITINNRFSHTITLPLLVPATVGNILLQPLMWVGKVAPKLLFERLPPNRALVLLE